MFSTQNCQLVKTAKGKVLKVPYILTAMHSWVIKINDQFSIIHADEKKTVPTKPKSFQCSYQIQRPLTPWFMIPPEPKGNKPGHLKVQGGDDGLWGWSLSYLTEIDKLVGKNPFWRLKICLS